MKYNTLVHHVENYPGFKQHHYLHKQTIGDPTIHFHFMLCVGLVLILQVSCIRSYFYDAWPFTEFIQSSGLSLWYIDVYKLETRRIASQHAVKMIYLYPDQYPQIKFLYIQLRKRRILLDYSEHERCVECNSTFFS